MLIADEMLSFAV